MGFKEIEVWLDIGREGRCFTYSDGNSLGIDIGDIVLVRLKGRKMHGLVVQINRGDPAPTKQITSGTKYYSLSNIDALLQKAAVEPSWREWIESTAAQCHISSYKMIKAALPSGWLGKGRKNTFAGCASDVSA